MVLSALPAIAGFPIQHMPLVSLTAACQHALGTSSVPAPLRYQDLKWQLSGYLVAPWWDVCCTVHPRQQDVPRS